MKKSLLHLAVCQAALAVSAAAASRSPSDRTIVLTPQLGDNDEKFDTIKPIITREMLAGTQPRLQQANSKPSRRPVDDKKHRIIEQRDLNPVSLAYSPRSPAQAAAFA